MAVVPTANITSATAWSCWSGVWSNGKATAKSVTDSAGNTYVEVQHFRRSDNTELSVWTAPIPAGGGTKPNDHRDAHRQGRRRRRRGRVLRLFDRRGTAAIDQARKLGHDERGRGGQLWRHARDHRGTELALGFYVDSGFGDTVTAGSAARSNVNVSNRRTWSSSSRISCRARAHAERERRHGREHPVADVHGGVQARLI